MKYFLIIAILFIAFSAFAEPENVVTAGLSYNGYSTPNLTGNLAYAKRLGDGWYNFNLVDVASKQTGPFSAAVSITPGIARRVMTFGKSTVYTLAAAGVMAGGDSLGFSWSAGGAVIIPLRKGFYLMPNIRTLKASLTDYQCIAGISIGIGK
jgi:hypothetical protein